MRFGLPSGTARWPGSLLTRPGAPQLISMDESDTERVLERRLEQFGGRVERSTQLLGFRVDGATGHGDFKEDPTARRRLKHGSWSAPTVRTARFAMRQRLGSRERPIRSVSCPGSGPRLGTVLLRRAHLDRRRWIGCGHPVAGRPPVPGDRTATTCVRGEGVSVRSRIWPRPRCCSLNGRMCPFAALEPPSGPRRFASSGVRPIAIAAVLFSSLAMPPTSIALFGGQGMNTGIQDAFNLGWKVWPWRHEIVLRLVCSIPIRPSDIRLRRACYGEPIWAPGCSWPRSDYANRAEQPSRRLSVSLPYAAATGCGFTITIGYRNSFLSVDADDRAEVRGRLRHGASGLRAGDRVPDETLIDSRDGKPVALFGLIPRMDLAHLRRRRGLSGSNRSAGAHHPAGPRCGWRCRVHPYLVLDTPATGGTTETVLLDPTRKVADVLGARQGLVAWCGPMDTWDTGGTGSAGRAGIYLARVFAMRLREVDFRLVITPHSRCHRIAVETMWVGRIDGEPSIGHVAAVEIRR